MSERLNRYRSESLMSKAGALAFAEKLYEERRKWPVHRFRVEGSRAGSSRFLEKVAARSAASRYGGQVVELIQSRTAYRNANGIRRQSPKSEAASSLGDCSLCGVKAGTPCETPQGLRRYPHCVRKGEVKK